MLVFRDLGNKELTRKSLWWYFGGGFEKFCKWGDDILVLLVFERFIFVF